VIGPPWTESRRRLLVDSRVKTTEQVIEWCRNRESRPAVLISASAIGYYGPAGEEWLDETSPPQPQSFQSQLCMAREVAADAACGLPMRVVNLRIGLGLARMEVSAATGLREAGGGGDGRYGCQDDLDAASSPAGEAGATGGADAVRPCRKAGLISAARRADAGLMA
jgi:hypothetical protein